MDPNETIAEPIDPADLPEGSAPPAPEGDSPFAQMKAKFQQGMEEVMAKSNPKAAEAAPKAPAAPAKAKPAPKQEAAPAPAAELEIPATIKSPKAADDFRKLAADRDTWRQQAEKWETEIKAIRTASLPEVEAIRTERDKLHEELERVALDRSPAFQQKYQSRFNQALTAAKRLVGEQKAAAIEQLMHEPATKGRNAAVQEMADGMDEFSKLQLVGAFTAMDQARYEREFELDNHKQTIAKQTEFQRLTQQSAATQSQAMRQHMLTEVLKIAPQKFEAFKRTDNAEHNAKVAEFEEDVRQFIMGEVDDSKTAMLPVLASEGLYLQTVRIPELQARIKELEAENAKFTGANPRPSDAGERTELQPGQGVDGQLKTGEFTQRFTKLIRQMPQ